MTPNRAVAFAMVAAVPGLAVMPGARAAVPPSRGTACGQPRAASLDYMRKVTGMVRRLGVASSYPVRTQLLIQPEAASLVVAGKDIYGRSLRLAPGAAAAYRKMVASAARDGVVLETVSGYRSARYQMHLVEEKLHHGLTLRAALRENTAPGFSEHQTGCAVDITTPDTTPVDASFAGTRAYHWLSKHAARFGFRLSYGPHNGHGIEFEPWHWRYVGSTVSTPSVSAIAGASMAGSIDRRQQAGFSGGKK
ncbi:MAG: M15 family metallopeptidase [Gammaproteobacteria bacterium]